MASVQCPFRGRIAPRVRQRIEESGTIPVLCHRELVAARWLIRRWAALAPGAPSRPQITIRSVVRRCDLKRLNSADYFPLMSRLLRVTILRATAIGSIAAALSAALAPNAYGTAVKTNILTAKVSGLDISAYQHVGSPIDWGLLAADGNRFVAIEVSEGTYYVNRYYRSDARAATRSGLAALPYVFANPSRASGKATASFALKAAGSARGRSPLVVDLENDPYQKQDDCYSLEIPPMIAWITGFIGEAKALTGQLPVIYTTADWWEECTGDTAKFRQAALWLAAYQGTPPTAPSPWPHWTFLQYNNEGTLPGVGQTDLDYFVPTASFPTLSPPAKHKPKPAHPHKTRTTHPAKPKPKPARSHKTSTAQRGKPKPNPKRPKLASVTDKPYPKPLGTLAASLVL
jgi:GH25 family lysozyme M1 (1,4-beta-N-acetylmuramidase)